jgi:UDP-N-acetylglucosamine 4,6-dehydratase
VSENQYGKKVLITGAGTLGTALVKNLTNDPDRISEVRVIDQSEEALWRLEEAVPNPTLPRKLFLGDIRDKERMKLAMRDVDIVVHTAALKHVRYTNYNPIECVRSNIDAVADIVTLAVESPTIKTFVNISTDKACAPENIYGESKRIGETLTNWGNRISGKEFYSCRFGNFLGSRGSVFDRWKNQVGGITLTDARMNRFFILPSEVAEFIVSTFFDDGMYYAGGVVIPMMKTFNMGRIAEVCSEAWGMNINVIGADKGEKIDEALVSTMESEYTHAYFGQHTNFWYISPEKVLDHLVGGIDSSMVPPASKIATRKYLQMGGIIQ